MRRRGWQPDWRQGLAAFARFMKCDTDLHGMFMGIRRYLSRCAPQPLALHRGTGDTALTFDDRQTDVTDFVDIAIPANARAAAEALGLKVHRSITHGTWVRGMPRDEAEIAIACLRDAGFTARLRDSADQSDR
jgi:hypothetical protein